MKIGKERERENNSSIYNSQILNRLQSKESYSKSCENLYCCWIRSI